MDNMEEKLGAILGNPAMMQQIMSMAQSLGQSQPEPEPKQQSAVQDSLLPDIDPATIQRIIGLAGKTGIDKNQQALLHALSPYLPDGRIRKLEKAMRAAKLASLATSVIGSGGLSFLTGR